MLIVKDLSLYFGAIHALHGISFHVEEGEIVTLIGANGAGKTSILCAISRILPIKTGDIIFNGNSITNTAPHLLPQYGLSQVPEGRRVFARMSVKENLEMGAFFRKDTAQIRRDRDRVYEQFPRLKERRHQLAGTLSGGEQQMLAIGRALMSSPKLLMMDEPSMGLSPILVSEIFEIIKTINEAGTTVLLVEQNANMALSVSHRGYVLETGKIIAEGKSQDLLNNELVKKAYLGIA
ncbi:MAG: ABC transporter ATP-binding protein [Christensenellales bacterium]|jgi:branched-chain amino acid transport system ATP-binding protein|nr:ABC transporter ATP-binding protein [Clostridiales bacterium]